ncbi:hypothetical protein SAY86_013942 [Trapa natans]|uniref:DUF547 domain-containing protein n=1 Tax=Trapa natans TaxID=22666 RepID=A0AAN7KRU8_TRANT|nr:hypothetical protein SAY86_013942 [Trapa natans]
MLSLMNHRQPLGTMKFEDLLMARSEEGRKRADLEHEVLKLEEELEGEQAINTALKCALHAPISAHLCLSSLLPRQVRKLLSELAMVEEEIFWLEKKVEKMKLRIYRERKQTMEWRMALQPPPRTRQRRSPHYHLVFDGLDCPPVPDPKELEQQWPFQLHNKTEERRKHRVLRQRRASAGSASDIQSSSSSRSNEELTEKPMKHINGLIIDKPNELSEDLIRCLIEIFLQLNRPLHGDIQGHNPAPKLALSCMNSRSFPGKTVSDGAESAHNLDPYGILSELDGASSRDVGPYKSFTQITRRSLEIYRFPECLPAIKNLRILQQKLANVDLTFLTHKQKLAFWINIYNASIMHAFLEQGLPSTQEKLLDLMNKAALNIGGIVLNALAVEHFILRHPNQGKQGVMDEKEVLLRHAYGLALPEPNVTFALCRGSWSSPALRVYTAEEVVNELGRAKVEYLEASVTVTSKRKIILPKLLQWQMRDFADNLDSLLEWIYSQLPRSGTLKRLIMECLECRVKSPAAKMVEIRPYEPEFRYLLACEERASNHPFS